MPDAENSKNETGKGTRWKNIILNRLKEYLCNISIAYLEILTSIITSGKKLDVNLH